jgi:hypothetical protein
MDRLLMQNIDPSHKAPSAAQRVASRKAVKRKKPRSADDYRGAKRNARSHVARTNPSLGKGYLGPIALNRSRKWKYAETYFDARDLSPSNREVA